MNKTISALLLGILVALSPCVRAQDKEKVAESTKPAQTEKGTTPIRLQVIFSEYEGDKKIGNLPYTLIVEAKDNTYGARSSIRMGLRVPIEIGSAGGSKQIQYMDIGTNVDGQAMKLEDERFRLTISVEKSSLYAAEQAQKPISLGGRELSNEQPTTQQFRSQIELLVRDGQTLQATVATDPVTGHVTKVDVTLNIIK